MLVNNAGIGGPTSPVADMDPDAWEAVMQINLHCTFNVTRLAIPALKQSKAASIIIMSSAAGRFGYANRSAYATSKWGLIGFTKTLSLELGAFGIRVNAILPAAVAGARMERVLAGRAQLSGRTHRRRTQRRPCHAVDQTIRGARRSCLPGTVSGLGCGQVDFRTDAADRQRHLHEWRLGSSSSSSCWHCVAF